MNANDKLYSYVLVSSILLFIGGIFLINMCMPPRIFSEAENRKLEQIPILSFQSVIDKQFTKKYETYISDQFAFRDFWVAMKSHTDRSIGKKENNGVYMGKEGTLIQKFQPPKEQEVIARIQAIHHFNQATPNVNKYVMLAPTAISVLDTKLPYYAPHEEERCYMNQLKGKLDKSIHFIDIYDALHAKKNEYIYYRTDHHWTSKGAFYAYQELGRQMGFTPQAENTFDVKKITNTFYGSLYSKGGFRSINPDSIELYTPKKPENYQIEYVGEDKKTTSFYEMENINKKDKYTVFFGGNHPLIKITNTNKNGQKLLVVKDSYANSILPFLAAHFSEIYVVDLRYYKDRVQKLIQNQHIPNMLILYNATTFFEDTSIENISD
ncbi:TPA: DHHW family protein [Bacillus cereus]